MKFVGVMILVQLISGAGGEPKIETQVLAMLPHDECVKQATSLNKTMTPTRFTKDGKLIIFEERQCAAVLDSELAEASKKMENVPDL